MDRLRELREPLNEMTSPQTREYVHNLREARMRAPQEPSVKEKKATRKLGEKARDFLDDLSPEEIEKILRDFERPSAEEQSHEK